MADNNGTPLPAGAPYNRGEQLKMWLGGEAELPPGAPYNRDEQLVMWLGDEAELPPGAPYNRDEQLTMWLKDHIGGGGGNPNYVETIQGTLNYPFGSYSLSEIKTMLKSDDYTLKVSLPKYGEVECDIAVDPINDVVVISWFDEADDNVLTMCRAYYTTGIVNILEYDIKASSDYGSIQNVSDPQMGFLTVVTLLKIIHHPLPNTP